MNLRQLKYFCEVVECGSAAAAAERLHVAPTAISAQLAQLEEDLGGPLFDRSRRPMSLTTLGRYFHPRAKELMRDVAGLQQDTRLVAEGRSGLLSIGYTRSSIFTILPRAIRAFRATHPNVRFELVTMLSEHQAESLVTGRIDIGIARYLAPVDTPEGVQYTHLMHDPFVVALSVAHPLATRDVIQAHELNDSTFIAYPKDAQSRFSEHTRTLLHTAGLQVGAEYEANDIHTALGMVAADLGYALVGRSVAQCNRPDVCFVPIAGFDATAHIVVATAAGEPGKLVSGFVQTLVALQQA